jgi:hypothetical protein
MIVLSSPVNIKREFLLHGDRSIKLPMIKGVREVSRVYLEEICDSSICTFDSLSCVNEMQFKVIEFSVDDVFRLMMNVEAVSFVDFGNAISGDVDGGESEGGGQNYFFLVVGDLGVLGIWRRVDIED